MDKFEYKIRADEIKELIAQGEYTQAAEIADTIDWRRVKSVMMLCTISDLYKINRRFEDAKNMLLLAYERRPGGRTICYSLCELCIKTEEFVQAVNYYKEFVQAAPKDSGRYILQYKLYEAQDVSLEERISVLEELKKRDYREKWAYELAYLYHRVGLATKCVEECDELILWFGEGKYVVKAMELKMLHQPLTTKQQQKYEHRFDEPEVQDASNQSPVGEQHDEQTVYGEEVSYATGGVGNPVQAVQTQEDYQAQILQGDTLVYENLRRSNAVTEPAVSDSGSSKPEEMDIQVKTMDMGQYNTLNLQAELAAGLKEVLGNEKSKNAAITRSIVAPMMDTESLDYPALEDEDISVEDLDNGAMQIESTEVFFGETGDLKMLQPESQLQAQPPMTEQVSLQAQEVVPELQKGRLEAISADQSTASREEASAPAQDVTADLVMNELRMENTGRAEEQVLTAQPPKELAGVLSQESDGQISLVMPEAETVEKQITGQMSIQDILSEWEKMKKEGEERRREEVRKRVLQQTGDMFTEFEASVRDGLLEQLESGAVEEMSEEGMEPETLDTEGAAGAESAQTDDMEPETIEEPEGDIEETYIEPGEEYIGDFEDSGNLDSVEEPGEAREAGEEEESSVPVEQETMEEPTGEPEPTEEPPKESVGQPEAVPDGQDAPEEASAEREKAKVRTLTREEKELFAPFIQSRTAREQLATAIDNISMAAYTGNVIVTGEEGMDTATLAKDMIRDVKMTDSNFTGKVAKISGQALNQKNVPATLEKLKNGALIILKASGMNSATAAALNKELQRESLGIIVVMEDTRKAMNKLLERDERLADSFTARMNVEALNNGTLVSFGKQYAKEMEYSIDELGILALHTRIEELQTIDHVVTVMEVKEIVDEAIHHANRKTLGHFVDILLARRYDDEDMIVLSEKDFV